MVILILIIIGLCVGSFVNALVWRIHEQEAENTKQKPNAKYLKSLSVLKGRSICPNCKHGLGKRDLIPIFSWISLKGRCRYCKKSISVQYPLVEASTALLFIFSYIFWPFKFVDWEVIIFILWLMMCTGFMALIVYDFKWKILPDKIIFPLYIIGIAMALLRLQQTDNLWAGVINLILASLTGGGIFYILFQVSKGKWIGGGDVKLGFLLGLMVSTPAKSILLIFVASILGCVASLSLIKSGKLGLKSTIPFGPFLIFGAIITILFGTSIIDWYQSLFLI